MADVLDAARLGLAAMVALAALGALNKMRWGHTRPCLAGAMLLLVLGGAGHCVAGLRGEWAEVLDVLLYAGIVSLLLATQRTATWFLERWANPAASIVVILALAIGLGWVASAGAQDGQPDPVQMRCAGLARVIERAATYRDVDADLRKFTNWVERLAGDRNEAERAVLRREIARLWREKKSASEAGFAVYRRCVANLGDMGRES